MPIIINKIEASTPILPALIPTAAYARVSSGKDAMLHSLSAQVSYYSDYIQRHDNWEYKGVYTEMKTTSLIQFNYSYLSLFMGAFSKINLHPKCTPMHPNSPLAKIKNPRRASGSQAEILAL